MGIFNHKQEKNKKRRNEMTKPEILLRAMEPADESTDRAWSDSVHACSDDEESAAVGAVDLSLDLNQSTEANTFAKKDVNRGDERSAGHAAKECRESKLIETGMIERGDEGGEQEHSQYARLITCYPGCVALVIAAVVISFVVGVGLPQMQQGFEGYDARTRYEAKVADGMLLAVTLARMQSQVHGEPLSGQRFAPFSEEQKIFSIPFFFHSLSGNVLSEHNIRTQEQVLSRTRDIVKSMCYQGKYVPECAPPMTLMSELGINNSSEIKLHLSKMGKYNDLFTTFLGVDTDVHTGRTSWARAWVQVGGPLPGYHNLSHNLVSQLKKYENMFQRNGLLGPEINPKGWIPKIDQVISEEKTKNEDLLVFYGGYSSFPRLLHVVNDDLFTAIFSLVLVLVFMWLQLGSVFLAVVGMCGIIASFALALTIWKVGGNPTFTFMQGMSIYVIIGIGADDLFVFADAWKQSFAHPLHVRSSLVARFEWAWSRAFSSMTITSVTTIVSFLLVATSDVPVVYTFGLLTAILVLVGWLMAVTWFPACVVLHHKYCIDGPGGLSASRFLGCLFPICSHHWKQTSCPIDPHQARNSLQSSQELNSSPSNAAATNNISADGEDPENGWHYTSHVHITSQENELRNVPHNVSSAHDDASTDRHELDLKRAPYGFFLNFWYVCLYKREARLGVLGLFGCLALIGTILAGSYGRLSTKSILDDLLGQDNELQITFDLSRGIHPAWKRSGDGAKALARFVYGLSTEDPIDRTGTYSLGIVSRYGGGEDGGGEDGGGEPNLAKGNFEVAMSGSEGFDPTWLLVRGIPRFSWTNLTSEASQLRTLKDCETISMLPSVMRNNVTGKGQVYCFMQDFQTYQLTRGRPFPVPAVEFVAALKAWRSDESCSSGNSTLSLGCYIPEHKDGGRYSRGTGFLTDNSTKCDIVMAAYISANLSLDASSHDMALLVPEYHEWRQAAAAAFDRKDTNIYYFGTEPWEEGRGASWKEIDRPSGKRRAGTIVNGGGVTAKEFIESRGYEFGAGNTSGFPLPPCGWGWPFPRCGEGVLGATERLMWIATMYSLSENLAVSIPIQFFVSFTLLFLFLGNWKVALLTTSTVVGITASTFITFVAQGKSIGLYELLFISLTIGLGIDYVVHLAHAYNHSSFQDRCLRMKSAIHSMGVSVLSGAISTLLASAPLFFCDLHFFSYYGNFIFFVVMWSILWAVFFFPAVMMTWGPNLPDGDVYIIKHFKEWGTRKEPLKRDSDSISSHPKESKPETGVDGGAGRKGRKSVGEGGGEILTHDQLDEILPGCAGAGLRERSSFSLQGGRRGRELGIAQDQKEPSGGHEGRASEGKGSESAGNRLSEVGDNDRAASSAQMLQVVTDRREADEEENQGSYTPEKKEVDAQVRDIRQKIALLERSMREKR